MKITVTRWQLLALVGLGLWLLGLGWGELWLFYRVTQLEAAGCTQPAQVAASSLATPAPVKLRAADLQWSNGNLSVSLPAGVLAAETRLLCRFVDARFASTAVSQVEIWPNPLQPDPARVVFPLRQVFWEAAECDFYGYGLGTQYGWFRVAAAPQWQ